MMKTITRSEYLQLLGLDALARKHNAALHDILEAMEEITGEAGTDRAGEGHCADLVWSENLTVDEQLPKLGITVEG